MTTAANTVPLKLPMQRGEREYLPPRRESTAQRVVIGGHTVFLHTGLYPDGRLGEIFIHCHKQGTLVNALLDSIGISVSKGLQYGVPLAEFVDSYATRKFEPNGFVEDDQDIKFVDSILAWVFRRLAIDFLGREDLKSGGGDV